MNVTGYIECWTTAVADGVALLDEHNEGWWANIDLSRLDLDSPTNCILGQLYGTYYRGREALDIGEGEGDLYGLDCYQPGQFKTLTFMWTEVIKARRETAGLELE